MINRHCYTSCKDCIFAVYDGKTQIGCDLDRIEAFQKKGEGTVLEACDDTKEFYIINNHKCNCFRNQYYALNRPGCDHKRDVIEENKMQFGVIIFANDVESVKHTLLSLTEQNYPIAEIAVVTKRENLEDKSKYINVLNDLSKTTWRLLNLQDTITDDKAVDMVLHHNKRLFNFFVVLSAGEKLPDNVFQKIDDKINREIHVASAISHEDFTFYNLSLYSRIETPDKMTEFNYRLENNEEWKKEIICV